MVTRELAHPWDDWFNKMKPKSKKLKQQDYPTILLRKGKDYQCLTHSMTMQFRRQASIRGCKIRCQVRDEGNALEVMLSKTS